MDRRQWLQLAALSVGGAAVLSSPAQGLRPQTVAMPRGPWRYGHSMLCLPDAAPATLHSAHVRQVAVLLALSGWGRPEVLSCLPLAQEASLMTSLSYPGNRRLEIMTTRQCALASGLILRAAVGADPKGPSMLRGDVWGQQLYFENGQAAPGPVQLETALALAEELIQGARLRP